MSQAPPAWNVLAHGPIEPLAENLWRVEGALPGMSLKRNMTIARRDDGRLVVHNGIALEEPVMKEVEALGEIAFLVVPNGYHRLDAPAYKARYPGVRVLTPIGARAKVAEKVPVDGTYGDLPSDDAVRLEPLAGVNDAEGVMLVRSKDGVTVVLNDIVMNMDKKKDFFGWAFTTVLGSAPGPRISRLIKLLVVKDRRALRADLERLGAMKDLARLVVSHEKVASGPDARAALRAAAAYL